MNKLLLIANDTNSFTRIQHLIPWGDYGFHQIHRALNLCQVNRHLSAVFPNLVIIDAQFRDGDALGIIQQIRHCSQDTQIIVITSEKNFELAQAGINFQIAALLLWDELCSETLISILDRIIVNLDDRIHRQGIIKRQLFRDILKGKLPTPEEIIRYFEMPEAASNYIMFLIKRDMPAAMINTDVSPILDYYAVNWHGSNFPEELNYIATVNISMHVWCSLLKISDIRSSARTLAVSHSAAVALQASFKHQFHDTVSIAYSQPFSNFYGILPALDQLDECLEMQRHYGRARLSSYADFIPALTSCDELLRRTGERFSTCILNDDAPQAAALVKNLLQKLAREHYSYSCVSQACRLFSTILNGYCVKKRIATLEERFIHHNLPEPFCYGIGEMTEWFQNIISVLIKESGQSVKNDYTQKVQDVIDYLEQNYRESTDVNSLALHFHLSSDYLRHLFKKETGENLTNYITHVKIEKAKLMLSTGHYKINEIALMTGFNTSQYFGTVFRKQVGITPGEFIRQCKENQWKNP